MNKSKDTLIRKDLTETACCLEESNGSAGMGMRKNNSADAARPMKPLFGGTLSNVLSVLSACLLCVFQANTSAVAQSGDRNSAGVPPSSNSAQKAYQLDAQIYPFLQVGRKIGLFDSRIVINRPSPGDDYWYRLPYTISVVGGSLPDGVSVVQNSDSAAAWVGKLAYFEGTPTKAGTYSVTLRGTMADGIVTADKVVQLVVGEVKIAKEVAVFIVNKARVAAGKELSFYVQFESKTDPLSTSLPPGEIELKLTGLPSGLHYSEGDSGYSFRYVSVEGTPTQAGSYTISAVATDKDGTVLGSSTSSLEVMPEDFKPACQLLSSVGSSPMRQSVRYGYETWWKFGSLIIQNELGENVDGRIEAKGLPNGLLISAIAGNPQYGFYLSGTPKEAGTFKVNAQAVFEDGTTTPEITFSVEVLPALNIQYSGNYEGVVSRAEVNDQNGGLLSIVLTSKGGASGYLLHKFVRYPFASAHVIFDKETGDLEVKPPNSGVVFKGYVREDEQGYSTPEKPVFFLAGELQDAGDANKSAYIYGFRASTRGAKEASPYASAGPINLMVVNDPFQVDSSNSVPSLEEPASVDPVSQPTGISFSKLRILPTGVVTATVWAADGSAPATVATRICETSNGARFFTYVPVANASGKSTLIGSNFVNLDGDAAGTFTWFKNASNYGASYPGGIALQEYSGVIGARFVEQPAGLNLFGLEESIANAELDLLGADLSVDIEVPLTVSPQAIKLAPKAAVPAKAESKVAAIASAAVKVPSAPAASGVKIRYDGKTGMLTGSLSLKEAGASEARTVNFRGMLAPDGKSAMGHFTIPSADAKKKLLYAGELRVQPRN